MSGKMLLAWIIAAGVMGSDGKAAADEDHLIPEHGVFNTALPDFDLRFRRLLVDPIHKDQPSFYVVVLPSFAAEWVIAGYERSATLRLIRTQENLWYSHRQDDPTVITESKNLPLNLIQRMTDLMLQHLSNTHYEPVKIARGADNARDGSDTIRRHVISLRVGNAFRRNLDRGAPNVVVGTTRSSRQIGRA